MGKNVNERKSIQNHDRILHDCCQLSSTYFHSFDLNAAKKGSWRYDLKKQQFSSRVIEILADMNVSTAEQSLSFAPFSVWKCFSSLKDCYAEPRSTIAGGNATLQTNLRYYTLEILCVCACCLSDSTWRNHGNKKVALGNVV